MTPLVRTRVEQTLGELVKSHEAGGFVYWRHNREVHDGRARAIAEYYAANNYDAGPQPLVVGTLPGGESYLLDGQHRLRAGELLGDAARRRRGRLRELRRRGRPPAAVPAHQHRDAGAAAVL